MEENSIKDTTPAQVAANAEASFDEMEDKLDKKMTENDAFIIKAEKVLEEKDKVVQVPDKKAEETEGVLDWKKNNYFKPQSSLKPQVLEKESTFLETKQFLETFCMFLLDGYRGTVPAEFIWIHLQTLCNLVWFSSMFQKGLKEIQNLEEVIELIEPTKSFHKLLGFQKC